MRALEERGIGRPSTYASIIGTILDRGYVFKRGTALVPSFLAFSVVALLEQHFGKLVDYDFTARMEDDLDRIAEGDEQRVEWLKRFYFGGDGDDGLHDLVTDQLAEIDARDINSIPIGDGITLRVGRYGPYLERDDKRVSVPDDLPPDELTVEVAEELLAKPSGDLELGVNPETGRTIVARDGRYGPYVVGAAAGGLGREAPDVVAVQVDVARDGDARRRAAPPLAAAHRRRGGRRGGDARRTAATGRTSRRERSRGRSSRRSSSLRSRSTRRSSFSRSRRSAGGAATAAGPLREIGADPASEQEDRRPQRALRPVRHGRGDERQPAPRATTPNR